MPVPVAVSASATVTATVAAPVAVAVAVAVAATITAPEHAENTAHRGVPKPPLSARAYGLHRGVPGTPLCRYDLPVTRHDPHNGAAGQPPRRADPVRLSKQRGRPSAHHRRGRSPSIVSLATTPMVRRWSASDTEADQKAGAERHRNRRHPPPPGASRGPTVTRFQPLRH